MHPQLCHHHGYLISPVSALSILLPAKLLFILEATGGHNGNDSLLLTPSMALWNLVTFSSSSPLVLESLTLPNLLLCALRCLFAIFSAPVTSNLLAFLLQTAAALLPLTSHWDNRVSLCQARGIIPPALSPATQSCSSFSHSSHKYAPCLLLDLFHSGLLPTCQEFSLPTPLCTVLLFFICLRL